MSRKTRQRVTEYLQDKYNGTMAGETCERIRISRDGAVHCYGRMPFCNHRSGWWLAAHSVVTVLENMGSK